MARTYHFEGRQRLNLFPAMAEYPLPISTINENSDFMVVAEGGSCSPELANFNFGLPSFYLSIDSPHMS